MTRTPASRSTSTTSPSPSSRPARRSSPSWPAPSTTTPCGPRSSSRSRPSASSSATAARREFAKRHDLPYHVVGSDLAGVVLRTGPGVGKWKVGQEVVAHCLSVELEDADGHNDTMLDPQQRIWGFETNFGGLAELAIVKTNQLMPKPTHLSWEEAASPGLVNSTAYRQLISKNGAALKLGDRVLIWGASGGLGSYATQMALAAGATPICVVSSPEKAEICRAMGAELIIDRNAEGYRFWNDENTAAGPQGVAAPGQEDPRAHRRPRRRHRLRAPWPRDLRRQRLRRAQGRHDRHLRLDLGLHARVRQPLPLDEPQAHHLLALRELPRGVGGQRAHQPWAHPPHPVQDLHARRGRPGRARRPPATRTRARSASSPSPPSRAWASPTPRSAPSSRPRSTASATPDQTTRAKPIGVLPGRASCTPAITTDCARSIAATAGGPRVRASGRSEVASEALLVALARDEHLVDEEQQRPPPPGSRAARRGPRAACRRRARRRR